MPAEIQKVVDAVWKPRMHKALQFGDGKYVDVGNPLNGSQHWSIETWIFIKNAKKYQGIYVKNYSRFSLTITHDNTLTFSYFFGTSGNFNIYGSLNYIIPKEFSLYHVITVADNVKKQFRMYVNGELVDKRQFENYYSPDPFTEFAGFGRSLNSVENAWKWLYFRGLIIIARMWNGYAIEDADARKLYKYPFEPVRENKLVLDLNPAGIDVANSKWWDLSGKGNHGTIYGATEVSLVES